MSWSRSEPEADWDAVIWYSSGNFRDGGKPQARGTRSCCDVTLEERESDAVVVAGDRDLMRPEVMEKCCRNER